MSKSKWQIDRVEIAARAERVLSTPIEPFQNRSFREGYGSAAVSMHHGIHDFKFSADVLARSITKQFSYQILAYQINGAPIFDPDNPPSVFFPTASRIASRRHTFRTRSAP